MELVTPPKNIRELLERASVLSYRTIGELLTEHSLHLKSLTKGFIGQFIELLLGAQGSNLPLPDFPHLGIELKTLPLKAHKPKESTYVCTAPLTPEELTWEKSRVRLKLAKVLFVPIEIADHHFHQSRIQTPFLWEMDPKTEAILKQDWEELTELLYFGGVEQLNAKMGTYLQIRPKAAHSRILSETMNNEGQTIYVNPKGFYLRTVLTQQLLKTYSLARV